MKVDFTNQTVLITGATRGIGKRMADDFEACGAHLILTGTNSDHVAELNRECVSQGRGGTRSYHCVDFSRRDDVTRFAEEMAALDRIDVCVNNAGINRINPLEETLLRDWDDMVAVNLTAPFLLMRTVAAKMKQRRYGRIVNISSVFGKVSREKRAIYSATKFGLNGLTVSASNELSAHGILVNTISPGFVMTELTRKNLTPAEMEQLAAQVPARRFAEPEDISRVVLFVASPLNTYMTGQNVVVDGGFTNV